MNTGSVYELEEDQFYWLPWWLTWWLIYWSPLLVLGG
jgi:hypothetical protein